MNDEWIERHDVQDMFLLTTKQFERVLRNIKRRILIIQILEKKLKL